MKRQHVVEDFGLNLVFQISEPDYYKVEYSYANYLSVAVSLKQLITWEKLLLEMYHDYLSEEVTKE